MSTLSYYPLCPPACATCDAGTKRYSEAPAMIGESDSMRRLRMQLKRLGPHFRTVLLRGEAGTGKELVARTLHRFSAHAAGPFVVFSAADGDGLRDSLRAAHRGTIYLDGVDGTPVEMQGELLNALKSRERVWQGPILVHGLEARVIASTSEDLRVLAASGRFRQELYARLATVEVELPPLRERGEDVALLAEHFMEQLSAGRGLRAAGFSGEAMERLMAHRWPGNVRELRDLVERAMIESCGGRIEAEHISFPAMTPEVGPAVSPAVSARLQEVVEQHVFQVLKECAGNKVKAAEMLGISRSTLYRMLEGGLPGLR